MSRFWIKVTYKNNPFYNYNVYIADNEYPDWWLKPDQLNIEQVIADLKLLLTGGGSKSHLSGHYALSMSEFNRLIQDCLTVKDVEDIDFQIEKVINRSDLLIKKHVIKKVIQFFNMEYNIEDVPGLTEYLNNTFRQYSYDTITISLETSECIRVDIDSDDDDALIQALIQHFSKNQKDVLKLLIDFIWYKKVETINPYLKKQLTDKDFLAKTKLDKYETELFLDTQTSYNDLNFQLYFSVSSYLIRYCQHQKDLIHIVNKHFNALSFTITGNIIAINLLSDCYQNESTSRSPKTRKFLVEYPTAYSRETLNEIEALITSEVIGPGLLAVKEIVKSTQD